MLSFAAARAGPSAARVAAARAHGHRPDQGEEADLDRPHGVLDEIVEQRVEEVRGRNPQDRSRNRAHEPQARSTEENDCQDVAAFTTDRSNQTQLSELPARAHHKRGGRDQPCREQCECSADKGYGLPQSGFGWGG